MKTINKLALSRIKHNKSQSILTSAAMILATCLLMALGTGFIGVMDYQQKLIIEEGGNNHAVLKRVTDEQLFIIKNHEDVEAFSTRGNYASVIKDKMNASLKYLEYEYGEIKGYELTEGSLPVSENEIAGPPSFFERLGYKPIIGNKIDISLRLKGKGPIETKQFVISGILKQSDMHDFSVADTRIVYSAVISKSLADKELPVNEKEYTTMLRVKGEEMLNYDEIINVINSVAADAGIDENNISLNKMYLMWMLNAGNDMIGTVIMIAVLVIVLSGIAIYSIYYVSVITNIQELGKLKAIGATKKQMKRLLLSEGIIIGIISLPIGLLLGYFTAYIGLKYIIMTLGQVVFSINMFSMTVVFIVIIAVLATIFISLMRPMKMASKVSAVEAMRYQETGSNKKTLRKGYETVNLSRLSYANLSRNRKRTLVTIVTMGLSCVLFMAVAGLMGSVKEEDIARRYIAKGDFKIEFIYSTNDKIYPENNLNSLQQKNLMGKELTDRINSIDGVTNVEHGYSVLGVTDYETYEDDRVLDIGVFTEEDVKLLNEDLEKGKIDYNEMVAENGIIYPYDNFFEEYGFEIGDTINLTLYDGDKRVPFQAVLSASTNSGGFDFLMPKATLDKLIKNTDTTMQLYVFGEEQKYESIKTALQEIVDENQYFEMYSFDEEMSVAISVLKSTKYLIYGVLIIIGIISFMNLINTMIVSIVTRKRELGILQAIGLSDKQLVKMLKKEGSVFTVGTLLCAVTIGNILGYGAFLWGKDNGFLDVRNYSYPMWETILLIAAIVLGQMCITAFISKNIHKETLIERIREHE